MVQRLRRTERDHTPVPVSPNFSPFCENSAQRIRGRVVKFLLRAYNM